MKSALSEKIEDEYDAADLLEAVAHFEKEPKTHSLKKCEKKMCYRWESFFANSK